MKEIETQYTKTPFYGSRRLTICLIKQDYKVNRKRVVRLMRCMGLKAIYPKQKTTIRNKEHKIYPYLLKNTNVTKPDNAWSTDITYIRLKKGFIYLVAIMDLYSRFVLSWKVSITMEVDFCIEALKEAPRRNNPEIFNSDQGSQFTSNKFTEILHEKGAKLSMAGKGRCER